MGGSYHGRLYDVGISARMWHKIANFLCGTLSQIRIGDSASQPFVDSSIAQGLVLSTLLFNVLVNTLAASIRSVVPGVRLVPSDACRHTCHFCADDVVLLSESQIDLQAGLDACHAWGIRWRFTFGATGSAADPVVQDLHRTRQEARCTSPGSDYKGTRAES